MEIKMTRVTPAIARDWLKRNVSNRPLRRGVVDGHKAAYMRGEYITTHQGVAFAVNGDLLDGQHRLTAISEMPANFVCEMAVARNMNPEAFIAIDVGLKRTPSDLLHQPQGLIAVAAYFARLVEGKTTGITPQLLQPYVDGIEDAYNELIDYCPTVSRTWSSTSVRAPAVMRMLSGGDRDYIKLSYSALNHQDYDRMTPIVQALNRYGNETAKVSGRGRFNNKLFMQTYRAFDSKSKNIKRIPNDEPEAFFSRMREESRHLILKEPRAKAA